jgi:Zn-dependent peptidase ImmA (M78 family)/DNA-binding XRE family transcriptional regulator
MNLGERLKGARLRAGLNLRDLAAEVGVSAQAVSKYERGLDVPSSAVLIRLCRALKVNLEFLMRPVSIMLSQPSYRRKARLTNKDQRTIQAQVQDWLERYLGIEAIIASPAEYEMPKLERKVQDLKETEAVALALRKVWDLGIDPIENLIEVLETHGIKVGIVPGADDFDALTLWANEKMPIIVAKEGVPGDRQRFSIAHELGHIVLDCPQDWGDDLVEKAAYRFAGAFLAPAPAVLEELGERRQRLDPYELHLLKHKYGMSMQAWIHRAQDLEIISSALAASLYRWFRTNKWHRDEPGDPYPPETPKRMERLIVRALAEDVISASRASELLGSSLGEFWRHASKQHEGFPVPASP